jgi:hypothetical protein
MKFYNDDCILCAALLIKSNPMDEQEWTEFDCKLEVVISFPELVDFNCKNAYLCMYF